MIPILGPLPPPAVDVRPWLLIFLLISLTGAFCTLFYIALGYYASIRASRKLFFAMLFRLCRAPIRFFDITPLGRVLNRFVSDFGTVDGEAKPLQHNKTADAMQVLLIILLERHSRDFLPSAAVSPLS